MAPEEVVLPPSPPLDFALLHIARESGVMNEPHRTMVLEATRRATSPATMPARSGLSTTPSMSPRTRSPSRYQSQHSNVISVPPMQRAHSSPGVDSSGRFVSPVQIISRRPASPLGQYGRRRSPLRAGQDDTHSNAPSWSGLSIEPNIPENEELELPTTQYSVSIIPDQDDAHSSGSYSLHTFPRRRRPNSPLHPSASAPSLHARAVSPSVVSGSSSPSLMAQKYAYEPYPGYSSTSSMPSTPTSFRSRSPSISSLETIEDSPDAEEAARLEEEEIGKIREDGGEGRRRSSLELRGSGLRSNKERKRWSVCGAERRADFSLEPIEE